MNIKFEPKINVGIVTLPRIEFTLLQNCSTSLNSDIPKGDYTIEIKDNFLAIYSNGKIIEIAALALELYFENNKEDCIEINNVEIGINFHWDRREKQRFTGNITFHIVDNQILVINHVYLENYIASVISSEMNAKCSLELLKAHAVISRSWIIAQIDKKNKKNNYEVIDDFELLTRNDEFENSTLRESLINAGPEDIEEIIKWHDVNDHEMFDVCADDHCQRYQGTTRAINPNVAKAIEATRGKFLLYSDMCDARFSKCCGGITEEYESCWDNTHYEYLETLSDTKEKPDELMDLTIEENAYKFIHSSPKCFCNTKNKKILNKVLNNYDAEYNNFFRWQETLSAKRVAELIKLKTNIDFGNILDLIPLQRGKSSRIIKLKVVGEKCTKIFGKELEIRRILSETHLYSSAFTVDKKTENNELYFVLTGAGWGHGVGMCQIGAAVMAEKGYKYEDILDHYYPNSTICQLYH
ncbi:MAG: SpoIID/LytB domain-containing protein [Bacteroidales bacterium]|nr:SpoIID/LytB domain-containing protein [Bacteroidales bacterium]